MPSRVSFVYLCLFFLERLLVHACGPPPIPLLFNQPQGKKGLWWPPTKPPPQESTENLVRAATRP